jgi:hypothetical protein
MRRLNSVGPDCADDVGWNARRIIAGGAEVCMRRQAGTAASHKESRNRCCLEVLCCGRALGRGVAAGKSQAQRVSLVVSFYSSSTQAGSSLSLCFFPGVCSLPPDQCGDLARSRLFSLNGVSAGWWCWISLVPLSTRNQKEREERDRKERKGFGVFLRSLVLPAA